MFHKIPIALPKSVGYIKKQQTLLTDIGGKWFMVKQIKTPSNENFRTEKGRKEEGIRYQNSNKKSHQHWND